MLFDDITTEEDLGKLKCLIMRDRAQYARFLPSREACVQKYGADMRWLESAVEDKRMPSNAEMLAYYRDLVARGEQQPNKQAEQVLRKVKVRSNSGVAVVSLLTKPFPCPGKCIYCPNEAAMPKSYLSKEPAAARALANGFDPYAQVHNRLRALVANGHPVSKLEVIVIGGTWSFYDEAYQEQFISEIYRAANEFGRDGAARTRSEQMTLEALQKENETASARIIGLSIETRPDFITERELDRLRRFGVTKVEIGVQHLDDAVLAQNKRDMTAAQIAAATELMRNAGFKVVYHMMPNLSGSTPEMDISMFSNLFSRRSYHPDMLKVYPCVVLHNSLLYTLWERGEFRAYTDDELLHVLIEAKKQVPKYVRILRVIRDIPASYIVAGSTLSNMRQVIQADQKRNHWQCVCIRCREIRNERVTLNAYSLQRITYQTETGTEVFLSFEHVTDNKCAAFCRLRLPDVGATRTFTGNLEVLQGAALIRELHTYGQLVEVSEKGMREGQHRGLGMRLMQEAERIAREAGYTKMAVISGVGVREYYRNKLGYTLDRTYMVKAL